MTFADDSVDCPKVDQEHVMGVCRIGQGADCCRYLCMGSNGMECGKVRPRVKAAIDARVEAGTFTAVGDNCAGWGIEEGTG